MNWHMGLFWTSSSVTTECYLSQGRIMNKVFSLSHPWPPYYLVAESIKPGSDGPHKTAPHRDLPEKSLLANTFVHLEGVYDNSETWGNLERDKGSIT